MTRMSVRTRALLLYRMLITSALKDLMLPASGLFFNGTQGNRSACCLFRPPDVSGFLVREKGQRPEHCRGQDRQHSHQCDHPGQESVPLEEAKSSQEIVPIMNDVLPS